jgi:hypothetical protein
MPAEVRELIGSRHQAEQRGEYEPFGRLLWMITEHGSMKWPIEHGEGAGPDLARAGTDGSSGDFLLLGPWMGLPDIRVPSNVPCKACSRVCNICAGRRKKQCEQVGCGGRGWTPGPWKACPGIGCTGETGKFRSDCDLCHGSGQIPEQVRCLMCLGTGVMTCGVCKGTGKISTGIVQGSLDYRLPPCKTCAGTGFKNAIQRQEQSQFVNAVLTARDRNKEYSYDVLGPITAFSISDYTSQRTRVFDVGRDAAGDFMVMLVPELGTRKRLPRKAYLVGGVVRERGAAGQVA